VPPEPVEPPAFRPLEIVRVLAEHDVRCVIIGGWAATLHGSPFITYDVDLTPDPDLANLARLSDALRALDARVRTQGVDEGLPFAHDADSLAAVGVWNLVTPFGELDISFVPTGTRGFADLDQDAEDKAIADVRIRIASLADIVRSKQAANRPKDQRVLPTLREILASRYDRRQQTDSGAGAPRR
jgi:hypothetical protein